MRARAVVVAALVGVVLLFGATRASAHAQLSSSSPAKDQVLDAAPDEIELRFTEAVGVSDGSIEVYDANGELVAADGVTHPEGNVAVLPIADLEDGGYVVSWRVVSADAHPIQGAFAFYVGESTGATVALDAVNAGRAGSTAVGAIYGFDRVLVFASLLLLVGSAAFCAVVWPAGFDDRRVRRVAVSSALVAALATVAGILLQGPYERGEGLAEMLNVDVIGEVVGSRFGVVWLARLALLAAAILVLRQAPRRSALIAGAVVGVALLATPGAAGHASTGHLSAIALPVDVMHLAAAAMWLGGLVLLTVCVLPRASATDLEEVVPRFSRAAFASVMLLAATGTFQTWRQVANVDQLADTSFGRILLVKLGLFAGLLVLGAMSRQWVVRHYRRPRTLSAAVATAPGEPDVRRLRRSVGAEAAVAIVLLAVTAQLVNAAPARVTGDGPGGATAAAGLVVVDLGDVLAEINLDPGAVGSNHLHIISRDVSGGLVHLQALTATMRLPDRDLGPFPVDLVNVEHANYVAADLQIPFPGSWELELVATLSEFEEVNGVVTISVD